MRWVSWVAGVGLALDAIREAKLRAFLTVLGVIIGTGTIIGVGSILAGLDGAITDILRSFGPNTMIVFKFRGGVRFDRLTPEEAKRKPLTLEDAVAIKERCPSVEHASPYLFSEGRGPSKARFKGNEVYRIDIGGTEEGYAANGTEMKYGRFFTDLENRRRMAAVVVGEDVASNLMPNIDPTGKSIEVNGRQVEIVGVMRRPAASLPGAEDLRVLFPYFTMRKMFPAAREHMLVISAKEGLLPRAMDEVAMVLRQQRKVKYTEQDNFWISTAEQMVEEFHNVTAMVALVMIVLSSIGLLVGGIGVMNIMLVSVTERTREIGIRKAIGATRFDIVLQFLTEAATLTFIGGLLGMAFGWSISMAARLVFPSLTTQVPLWAALLGVGVSVGVGLFFGIWPAGKAARLDPVVALRYQ
ncbi:MAG TPA: ABC transporter permease [Bryobacteraceae bacterium]|nr:ABC transporter permease [Bryobacteraceae bacterium]